MTRAKSHFVNGPVEGGKMLVVISDLHFVDGTAGDHNVNCQAFKIFFEDIFGIAKKNGVKDITLVFNGDIFDLIRTEAWFTDDMPLEQRPWGLAEINEHPEVQPEGCIAKSLEILRAIIKETKEHCDVLSGRDPEQNVFAEAGINIRRVFVPGNHDRLFCVSSEIQALVHEALGITEDTVPGLSEHAYHAPEYGVIIRHGHEFDVWNFEGYKKEPQRTEDGSDFFFEPKDYLKVPIGDPITTELVVKLPYLVGEWLKGSDVRPEVAQGVYERLQNIENVRPVTDALAWVMSEVGSLTSEAEENTLALDWKPGEREIVAETIQKAVKTLLSEFMEIPFVKRWLDQHDKWTNPLDEADKLQWLARLGGLVTPFTAEVAQKFGTYFKDTDHQLEGATVEPLLDGRDYHYVVYGHTHKFAQVPLRVVNGHEKLYLNSGTWRPRFTRTEAGHHWVPWKEMTYLIFFRADEDPLSAEPDNQTPKGNSLLTWTGTMLKRAR